MVKNQIKGDNSQDNHEKNDGATINQDYDPQKSLLLICGEIQTTHFDLTFVLINLYRRTI